MVRINSLTLAQVTDVSREVFGELPAEVEGGEIIVQPEGTPVPTGPGRIPVRTIPRGRSPIGISETLIDTACSLFNPNPGGFVDRYLDFSEFTSSRGVADGFMRTICESPPGSPAPDNAPPGRAFPPELPYLGGQCPGDRYVITYRLTIPAANGETRTEERTSSFDWIGPIGEVISLGEVALNAYAWDLRHDLLNPQGEEVDRLSGVASPLGPPSLKIIDVSQADGSFDFCGNPAPIPPPADPTQPTPQPLPPVEYDPGDGGPPVVIAPELSIDIGVGGPRLNFRLPDVDISVDVGGIDITYPSVPQECCPPGAVRPGPEVVRPEPTTPIDPPPPSTPVEPGPDEEQSTVFRAVIVTADSIATPATAISASNGGPTVYAPRLGTLQFKVAAADGASGWTMDIDIKNAQQYIEVPAVQGAVDVAVFPYGTTEFRVVRLYNNLDSQLGVPTP